MKKFIFTLFILLILGGAVFFFGWVQFTVPPGAFGVVQSKTHGVDPRLVRSGEFRWIWYKLIPTNVQIAVFRLEPVNHAFNITNTLPSADTYAAFAGISADFSWNLGASISFNLNPDDLVSLVAEKNIQDQAALEAYGRDVAEKIQVFILQRAVSWEDGVKVEEMLTGGASAGMEKEIESQFPQIRDFSFAVRQARFPDFALYKQIRLLYEDFIMKQREYMAAALAQKAEDRIDTQLRFGELERYGELLTKYPVLLQYMALEGR